MPLRVLARKIIRCNRMCSFAETKIFFSKVNSLPNVLHKIRTYLTFEKYLVQCSLTCILAFLSHTHTHTQQNFSKVSPIVINNCIFFNILYNVKLSYIVTFLVIVYCKLFFSYRILYSLFKLSYIVYYLLIRVIVHCNCKFGSRLICKSSTRKTADQFAVN